MKKISLIVAIILHSFLTLNALEVPRLSGRVNDYAGILSSSESSRLESEIRELEATSSSQIAILTIKSLEGDNLEDFSIRVVDKWKLGTAENDNGVLLLISLAEKSIRLEVGYGLEGVLTDAKSDYIIRTIISPNFRSGDIYKGLSQGVTGISGVISGEYQITRSDLSESRKSSSSGSGGGSSIFSLLFFIMFVLFSILGRSGRHRRGGNLASILILNSLLGGSSRSSRGFGSSGGGFSGGGFSGGGGGFGGGGASGGW